MGQYKLWALVGNDLHVIKLIVPRIFYVNQRTPKDEAEEEEQGQGGRTWRKVNKTLPRGYHIHHLYEYSIPEDVFRKHSSGLVADLSSPDIEGIYESQVSIDLVVFI